MANEKGQSVFTQSVSATASNQELDLVTTRNEVTITATADCYINFDAGVDDTERYLIKANTQYIFQRIMVRKLNYLGSGTIYVMAWKSPVA